MNFFVFIFDCKIVTYFSDAKFSVFIICITLGLLILPLHIVIVLSLMYKNLLYLIKFEIKQNSPIAILSKENSVPIIL